MCEHLYIFISQAEISPDYSVAMKIIKAKFIASTKIQVEQIIASSHPYIKLEA
jgi:hypothetical protein